jgi:hypothetical protein
MSDLINSVVIVRHFNTHISLILPKKEIRQNVPKNNPNLT